MYSCASVGMMKKLPLLTVFICVALAQTNNSAKTGGAPPALIRGRVIDATTNEPIPDAQIRGFFANSPVLAHSDVEGKFEFVDIDNGLFQFRASKSGYTAGEYRYGVGISGRASLETLSNGSPVYSVVTIALLKMAAISGVVTADSGTPVPKAWVYLDAISTDVPLRNYLPDARPPQQAGQSDAVGRFSFQLTPGVYRIRVTPDPGPYDPDAEHAWPGSMHAYPRRSDRIGVPHAIARWNNTTAEASASEENSRLGKKRAGFDLLPRKS